MESGTSNSPSRGAIVTIIGTRPEAIKMLPVVRALRARDDVDTIVLTTGQHKHMLDQVFAAFGERPDRELDLMVPGQTLNGLAARVIGAMSDVLADLKPALVLVHGDTTTAMAAGLAAFHAGVAVGHVEAGLRSHDLAKPFPEEFNRVAIDGLAQLLFAPTKGSAANLRRESLRDRLVEVTGNTGIDALLHVVRGLKGTELDGVVSLDPARRLILVTGHRRESFGGGFERICEALARLADRPDVELVYPVHLNPNVQEPVRRLLAGRDNLHLIEPVDYLSMVALMQRAHLILTDSGGIQEEAPALGKPVLVMRDVTERPEAVECGVASLVGTDPDRICAEAAGLLDDAAAYAARARPAFPFGDGQAAIRIAATCAKFVRFQ